MLQHNHAKNNIKKMDFDALTASTKMEQSRDGS
jgi:hypothetical protein